MMIEDAELRREFISHMEVHDDTRLPVNEWLDAMLAAADEWLYQHGLREEPRAALVYYVKRQEHLD